MMGPDFGDRRRMSQGFLHKRPPGAGFPSSPLRGRRRVLGNRWPEEWLCSEGVSLTGLLMPSAREVGAEPGPGARSLPGPLACGRLSAH